MREQAEEAALRWRIILAIARVSDAQSLLVVGGISGALMLIKVEVLD